MIEAAADRAFAAARAAVAEGRIPGAALGIVTADGRQAIRCAGMASLIPEPEPLTLDHWFDLASLSKVIATTTDDPHPRRAGPDRPRPPADRRHPGPAPI